MAAGLRQFSEFVGELNSRTLNSDPDTLAGWAVGRLAKTVGFDCAWYGWAELNEDGAEIHAQSTHHLPEEYFSSWCEMSEQDVLAAAIQRNPGRAAVYERFGHNQTDGMISLADSYGLNKMATAMHSRRGRSASFFLSGYRGGRHSTAWSEAELDFLQCAVDQLSASMQLSFTRDDQSNAGSHSLLVAPDGVVVMGLNRVIEHFGQSLPEWTDDKLPAQLCDLICMPGEHVLVDRKLVVTCESNDRVNELSLHKLTLRRLSKFDLLTEREREVARLLVAGNSHKEVARLLDVAPATVRNQTQSIYAKVHVNSCAALASAMYADKS